MKNVLFLIIIVFSLSFIPACNRDTSNKFEEISDNPTTQYEWAIVIHGGADVITREMMTQEMDSAYREVLQLALKTGKEILESGGSALDAVEKTIHIMEDSPMFNAGKGAVFTNKGTNELDAAFMEGATLNAGAIAGVTNVRNPISAARMVMENSPHVMLTGIGASEFSALQGLEIVDPSYFYTDRRYEQLTKAINKEKNGTVGCCALDREGNLAAGTSTGGMTNKKFNRIGDVPIIGAGTYANNATCAVSATGHGEYFIRWTVAHDISALMEYKDYSLEKAADLVVNKKLVDAGGSGGIISVDRFGNFAMAFNSEGMYRGFARADGSEGIFIYRDE